MTKTISLENIIKVLPDLDTVLLMEEAFSAYSDGRAVVPPVGELIFEDPPGETHITAMGSDTAEKIELEPAILGRADREVVDSLSQSESRGEVYRASEAGASSRESVVELGSVVAGRTPGRVDDTEITVCDLTGVAVQDLMIARGVFDEVVGSSQEGC